MKNKKAQISSNVNVLTFASVMVVVLIIVITVGAIVASNLKSSISRDALSIVNESDIVNLLWANNSNMSLDHTEVTVSAVFNCSATGSEFTTINPENYTVFSTEGLIQCDSNATTFPHDTNPVCVNYTYLERNSAYNVSLRGESSMLTFSDFFGVITIIIAMVIVVGLLFAAILIFSRRT